MMAQTKKKVGLIAVPSSSTYWHLPCPSPVHEEHSLGYFCAHWTWSSAGPTCFSRDTMPVQHMHWNPTDAAGESGGGGGVGGGVVVGGGGGGGGGSGVRVGQAKASVSETVSENLFCVAMISTQRMYRPSVHKMHPGHHGRRLEPCVFVMPILSAVSAEIPRSSVSQSMTVILLTCSCWISHSKPVVLAQQTMQSHLCSSPDMLRRAPAWLKTMRWPLCLFCKAESVAIREMEQVPCDAHTSTRIGCVHTA